MSRLSRLLAPRSRLALGVALALPLPLLALLWALAPAALRAAAGHPGWLSALLGALGIASLAGVLLLWRAGRSTMASGASVPGSSEAGALSSAEPEETEHMMDSFSRMLGAVEQQASAIDHYALRLDHAFRDIETSNARLEEFSFRDEVTGLYNRRFFSIRLEEEISRYRRFDHPFSVVLLDLDGLKEINDELGHAAGDETLRGIADLLVRHSRGINVICRYGGDEFAVLLVETPKGGARLYADRIRDVLPTLHFAHGRRVTASFGIACLPEDVQPVPDVLMRAADEALYAAKRAGKNRVSLYEEVRRPPTRDR
jgi:diguanylate cyclase (GGDEF)-like protein